ncbi:MAG: hypothetical protein CVU65_11485 [Deltaproteobacteria bacterium HGW-Deltaproteobacteria-22]|nr:MAG: hypothetical protein CVU65_11485 [Deltaproteobacteria bacterium HGW-Deltaproteobacteria-22]
MKYYTFPLLFLTLLTFWSCDDGVTVTETCGDNFLDPGEECDGTEFVAPDCASLGYYVQMGDLTCTAACTIDTSACVGRCGDGEIQAGEEDCDGTNLDGQNCEALGYYGGYLSCGNDCHFNLASCEALGRCGDGEIQGDEACDGAQLQGANCLDLEFYDGQVACTDDCTLDYSDCYGACGDDQLQTTFEACDGDDLNGETCESMGYYGGTLACQPEDSWDIPCAFELTPCEDFGRCGDNRVQTAFGEECDGAALNGANCQDVGRYTGIPACNGDCTLNFDGCTEYCGDGVLNGLESCDGTAFGTATCQDNGFYEGTLTCSGSCDTILNDNCSGFCGDGLAQTAFGEECDGADLAGQTCQTRGFGLGTLSCNSFCARDARNCEMAHVLDAGYNHTCVIGTPLAGTPHSFFCWGQGTWGQIGNSNWINQPYPVKLNTYSGAELISAGGFHTCGTNNGGALCWGEGTLGQLGEGLDDPYMDFPLPIGVNIPLPDPPPISSIISISAGLNHSCAVDTPAGDVWCWGANQVGQLGRGNTSVKEGVPAVVASGSDYFNLVSAGEDHTCAITTDNALYCWGGNAYGQLGNGDTTNLSIPGGSSLSNVVQVSAGKLFTCARNSVGVFCWGRNDYGQLSVSTTTPFLSTPQAITGMSNSLSVSAGGQHACNVTITGAVYCWGRNDFGQLGNAAPSTHVPTVVAGLPAVAEVSCGEFHTCARTNTGVVWCWGRNDQRQLGNLVFTAPFSSTPVMVSR